MISVIVPSYNREECLYRMIRSFSRQRYSQFEILVIDQSDNVSEEKIAAVTSGCRGVHYYHIKEKGRCVAKNFAIDKAKGDILLFCDDDIIVAEGFLEEHARVHDVHPEVGAMSCHLIEPHEQEIECSMPLKITCYGRFVNKPNAIYEGYVTSLNGGNMSFKRAALECVGYFDENLKGTSMLEEPDIAYRIMQAGYKVYFSSRSRVRHFPQYNGNISIKKEKKQEWLLHYFHNQYFFVLRNRRKKYLLLVVAYLVYRIVVEAAKNKILTPKFLNIPAKALVAAARTWNAEKINYQKPWFTSKRKDVTIIQYISNEHAKTIC